MNIIVIDISHNSSWMKVSSFLSLHKDADIIYTFDFQYYKYYSSKDLRDDINNYSEDFFTKPCAYYDMVTAILSRIWSLDVESVTVFSPEMDECSRMSNELRFNNLIRHYCILFPESLNINYSVSTMIKKNTSSLTRQRNRRFSIKELLHIEEYPIPSVEYYDYIEEDETLLGFPSIIDQVKSLFIP